MKRFVLILTALLLVVSLCSCGKNDEITVGDNQLLAGRQAGNDAVDYSFAYPNEWTRVRNDGTIELQFDYNPNDAYANYATFTALAFALAEDSPTVKSYWEVQKARVEDTFNDYKELDVDEYDTPEEYLGKAAPAMKVKYSFRHMDMIYISEQIICVYGNSVYLLTLTVPEEGYVYSSSIVSVVRDSFVFG